MGMNVWCCRWWTITYEKLKELCGPEVLAVEATFDDEGEVGWLQIASDDLDDSPAVAPKVIALRNAFESATGGLELVFLPYDADMDDCRAAARDREHEGILFGVDGVEQFTPAGEKFKDALVDTKWIEAG